MSATNVDTLIEAYVRAEMTARQPNVALLFDNEDGTQRDSQKAEWVRVSITALGPGEMTELDSRISQHTSRLITVIHTPLGKGTTRANEIHDSIRDMLQGVTLGGRAVRFRATERIDQGVSMDNTSFTVFLATPFLSESQPNA